MSEGGIIGSLITALIGAVILLAILRLFSGGRARSL
ncbi:GlsB/YeaQ/YmgE family stress response membrane protein [Paraburkholderia fungorum]